MSMKMKERRMKPEEAIEVLSNELIVITDMIGYCRDFEKESDLALAYRVKRQDAYKIAISALKELQQYREIGTVEECREARANQKPKIVKDRKWAEKFQGIPYCVQGDCRKCGCKVIKSTNTNYCYVCGPLLNWNDEWTDDDLREFFI